VQQSLIVDLVLVRAMLQKGFLRL